MTGWRNLHTVVITDGRIVGVSTMHDPPLFVSATWQAGACLDRQETACPVEAAASHELMISRLRGGTR